MEIKFYLILILLSMLWVTCETDTQRKKSDFSLQFHQIEKIKFSDYDSLLNLYHHIHSEQDKWNPSQIGFFKNYLQSLLYYRQGDYNAAIRKTDAALASLAEMEQTDSIQAHLYNAKGVSYMSQNQYDSALIHFYKANILYEKLKMPAYLQKIQANLAQLYYDKGDTLRCNAMIDSILKNPMDLKYEMKAKHLKANLLGSQGQIERAIALDYKVIRDSAARNEKGFLSMFYNNLALCYLEKNQIDSAIFFCHQSLYMDSVIGNEMNLAANYGLIADIYLTQNQWSTANTYYQKALNIFTKNQNNDKKLALFKQLKNIHQSKGDLSEVVRYQDSIQQIESQINGLAINRSIELLNIEYETSRKNQQLENQRLKLSLQRIGLWGLLLLIAITVPLMVVYFKMKNRQTEIKLIKQKQQLSQVADEAEQNERKRIAGDLHDSVSQKLAVAKMRLSILEPSQNSEKIVILQLIDQSINEVRNISHNLAPKELENGLLPSIESLIEQLNYSQKRSKITFEAPLKPEEVYFPKNISLFLYRILQETLHNAIKHAEAQNIKASIAIHNSQLILTIADDGKGFDKEKMYQFTGMGLRNLQSRVEQMHGKIQIDTAPNQGTKINIFLHLSHE